jgi:hypothetical protein
MASITMAMPEPTTNRLLKKPVKARIYTHLHFFLQLITGSGNTDAFVWKSEIKAIFMSYYQRYI